MKTVTLQFVVDDEEADLIGRDIETVLGAELSYPLFCWNERESNEEEIKWKKEEYDA